MNSASVYVYCVVAAGRRPRLTRVPAGLPGAGRVRLLDVGPGLFIAVADLPRSRYSEAAIHKGLADLDWVSRVAVAHDGVIEAFVAADAVLPMQLFTMFTSDDRAIAHIRAQRSRLAALITRVARHQEWGVRIVLDRARAVVAPTRAQTTARAGIGAAFLARKKVQRDAAAELAPRARETVEALFDRLADGSCEARRRAAREIPAPGGPLLLDAAFLVPRARAARFKALAAREAKALARQGYAVAVTGPWPPYSFVQD